MRAYIYPLPRTGGAALAAGLQELSPASRYQRFLSSRERFTRSELEFLTNCDGVDHIALVLAVEVGRGKRPRPVAVARCVRDLDNPDLAEVAIAVADRWQGRGVGGVLLRALHARAWNTGTRRWRAFLFAENVAMSRLLERSGELLSREFDGPGSVEAIYALRLPPEPPDDRPAEGERWEWTPLIWIAGAAAAFLVSSGVLRWKMRRGSNPQKVSACAWAEAHVCNHDTIHSCTLHDPPPGNPRPPTLPSGSASFSS
jgi:RimJ/RimL family protein N-acetyltransferase